MLLERNEFFMLIRIHRAKNLINAILGDVVVVNQKAWLLTSIFRQLTQRSHWPAIQSDLHTLWCKFMQMAHSLTSVLPNTQEAQSFISTSNKSTI